MLFLFIVTSVHNLDIVPHRFYGRIADNPDSHDEETLKAIQQNASGLEKISGERIWSELKRIVIGNFAAELMKKMLDVGLSPYIGILRVQLGYL